jgi:hypothetical protein
METPMLSLPYILAGILILFICLGFALVRVKKRSSQSRFRITYTNEPPTAPFDQLDAPSHTDFNDRSLTPESQSDKWNLAMQTVGQCLDRAKIDHIYFTHGTFVGEDPYGILTILKRIYPNLSQQKELSLKKKIKEGIDWMHRDNGNFPNTYVDLFKKATCTRASCSLFRWSSGNHHIARVKAALALIHCLAKDITDSEVQRFLLIGHSHAGQVFALFSLIVGRHPLGEDLLELIHQEKIPPKGLRKDIAKLQRCHIDFFTMGTPIRYPWCEAKNFRIIHIVNHPGKSYLAPNALQVLSSDYGGDYMQQWGIVGSDYLAVSKEDRKLNRHLDRLLGPGIEPHSWLTAVKKGMRVHPSGHTYLVDYKNKHPLVPDGITGLFGHGIYTRLSYMRFTAELICKTLYQSKSQKR